MIFHGLGSIGVRSVPLMSEIDASSRSVVNSSSAQTLSMISYTFAKLRGPTCHHGEKYFDALVSDRRALERLTVEGSVQHIYNVLWSLAKVKHERGGRNVRDAVDNEAVAKYVVGNGSTQEISGIFKSLAIMGLDCKALVKVRKGRRGRTKRAGKDRSAAWENRLNKQVRPFGSPLCDNAPPPLASGPAGGQ